MRKKFCFLLFFLIATIVFSAIFFFVGNKQSTAKSQHRLLAENYVEAYILDNPGEQYYMLDVSLVNPNNEIAEKVAESYDRKPLVRKNLSVEITNTREATESIVKLINKVYMSVNTSYSLDRFIDVKKAYRYNVKIKDKKISKNIHNVSFWVIQTKNDEYKVCTMFEYERAIDKCVVHDMY